MRTSLMRSSLAFLTSMPRLCALTLISTTCSSSALASGSSRWSSWLPWAATMPACRAAPRATTSLTARELSAGLPVSSGQHLPGHRHVRRAAHQQHPIHLVPAQPGLAQHLLRRQPRPHQQVARQGLELRPADRHRQHLAAVRAGDRRLRQFAQGALGALGGGAEAGQRLRIVARVGAVLLAGTGSAT